MTYRDHGRLHAAQPLPDLVCLSHLRWHFVFQRPQHLMTRFARERRVFYVEEAVLAEGPPRIDIHESHGVHVCVPHLPASLDPEASEAVLRRLLTSLARTYSIGSCVRWYYTPMALPYSDHLPAEVVVYDCMDELSAFRGAPPALLHRETDLLAQADVVFTGGVSLYESKRQKHPRVFAFPSSVDVPHFAQARVPQPDPQDQTGIPRPRLGFFGVLDERLDVALLQGLADSRPDWQFVLLGPVVKIDPATLPQRPNVHYLGAKPYDELPTYLAGWDVALLLFAHNESTRFISPTKTPEYLAAGTPVVSTSIRDVVRPYGDRGLVRVADSVEDFVTACDAALAEDRTARWAEVDEFLSTMSWDRTWAGMKDRMVAHVEVHSRIDQDQTAQVARAR